ncbi:MAG: hypothetical protein IT445_13535 [Phycisphaeraceae bacterium]|nr:hypothetical protein [Phycisphaeraceae bacterium]
MFYTHELSEIKEGVRLSAPVDRRSGPDGDTDASAIIIGDLLAGIKAEDGRFVLNPGQKPGQQSPSGPPTIQRGKQPSGATSGGGGELPQVRGMISSAADEPILRSGAAAQAVTKDGRRLVAMLERDPDGKKVGVRSINEMLRRRLDVEIREGLEQTTPGKPASYMGSDYHLIRTCTASSTINFHELGHALDALIRDKDPVFVDKILGGRLVALPDFRGRWLRHRRRRKDSPSGCA